MEQRVVPFPEFMHRGYFAEGSCKDIEYVEVTERSPDRIDHPAIIAAEATIMEFVAEFRQQEWEDKEDAILQEDKYRLDWWEIIQKGRILFFWPAYEWKLIGSKEKLAERIANQGGQPILGLCVSLCTLD